MFDQPYGQDRLFRNESSLSAQYTPDEVIGRETEIDHLVAALQPIARRQSPDHVLVYGPAGVGKTTTVEYVCGKLEDQTRVATAQINCWQYNTRPALLTELLIQLGYPAPRKGKPVDALVAKLQEWLGKQHSAVVALDEFDQLTDQAAVLYDLQEASDAAEHPLGLLLVSNQPPEYLELEPRSQSRISYRPLEIRPYTEQDLAAILHDRVDQAFHPETVTDAAIDHIAATVADQNGDCREALTLLLRAGRLAEQQNADTVTPAHVEQSTRHG